MGKPDSKLETIRTRPAKSGRVSYGSAVLLHDSSRSRVVLVPFLIPRTGHKELAVKILTFLNEEQPLDWELVEHKSISLGEQSARNLHRALETYLHVAETGADGSFLVIRLPEGTAQFRGQDPTQIARALAKVLGQPEIVEHLEKTELSEQLVEALRGAVRLSEMRRAVAALRESLEAGTCDESVYQEWCEKHSWAFGNAYVVRDEARNISAGDKLDLLLPTVFAGYRDIVELKRPNMPVLNYDDAHRNFYFSSEVSKAIGQCHRYLDILHENARDGLLDHPEIVAYHPRATVVIGRSTDWDQKKLKALHGLNGRLSGITVMTYDHLLAQGERLIEMLGPEVKDSHHNAEAAEDFSGFDDDIPF